MILCSIEKCAIKYDGNNSKNITHFHFKYGYMHFSDNGWTQNTNLNDRENNVV